MNSQDPQKNSEVKNPNKWPWKLFFCGQIFWLLVSFLTQKYLPNTPPYGFSILSFLFLLFYFLFDKDNFNLRGKGFVIIGFIFLNVGFAIGAIKTLSGYSAGFKTAAPILFCSTLLIVSAVLYSIYRDYKKTPRTHSLGLISVFLLILVFVSLVNLAISFPFPKKTEVSQSASITNFLQTTTSNAPTTATAPVSGYKIYSVNCAICHQADGMGDPLKAPPLTEAEWLRASGVNRLIRILLDGITGPVNIGGKTWDLTMPSWKDNLTDEQIAAVLTYTRSSWGNQTNAILPAQVKAIRDQTKTRATPWTAEELLKILEK